MNSDYSSEHSENGASSVGGMGSAGSYGADMRSASGEASGQRMRDEFSNLKSDLDALIGKASSLSEGELREARDRLMAQFEEWQHSARGFADQASEQLHHGMDATSDYVKEKPLQSVAIAAGVGLLLGALLRR